MSYLIVFLAGIVFRFVWEYLSVDTERRRFNRYKEDATRDLRNFQSQVNSDLFKANEQFAKNNLTGLLYDILKDISKEKK